MNNTITIVSGMLLTISEILPFITKIESNGIFEFTVKLIEKIFKKSTNQNESEPLLQTHIQHNTNIQHNLENVNYEDINYTLSSPETYEMYYIIRYIKINYIKKKLITKYISEKNKEILLKFNYRIDYDSVNDMYNIQW